MSNIYLTAIATPAAELGALEVVDEYNRPIDDFEADGEHIDQIDISDIYSENENEWERLIEERLESYGIIATRADERRLGGFHPRWKIATR